jgi:amidase
MTGIAFRPAHQLARELRSGALSSRELLEHYLARVEALNPELNAVVTLDAERALKRGDQADAARSRGESWGPLHGLPVTVKDCLETAGLRTTAGAPPLADHIPAQNAVAVQRLLDAGAVVFGKTNTPAWAMDWQTHNELFGTTRNPWDPERTPGGSSGGSAAAVAAGLTALELGSDIGGSIRIPSHCCGIFGHKPSWGIVPERGHIPGPPGTLVEDDINVVGPLARSAEDLALALEVLAGPLPDRGRAWRLELPGPRREQLRDFRVAAWLDDTSHPVDATVRERLEGSVEALRGAGVRVDDTARPGFDLSDAVDLYRRLLAPIVTRTFSDEQFAQLIGQAGTAPAGDGSDLAGFARDLGLRHRDWLALHDERERMRAAWAEFFRHFDLVLCPIAPLPAIRHDHSHPAMQRRLTVNGAARPYTDHFGWMGPIGVAHLPATAVPVGRTAEGLPVGIQVVAGYLEDRTAIEFARQLAAETGGFEPPPRFNFPPGEDQFALS